MAAKKAPAKPPAKAPAKAPAKPPVKNPSAGVDPALLAWVQKNYPGATAVHTGDPNNYLNGVQGQGVVFLYNHNGQQYTFLMPNSLPQYGIGGLGSSDTEPAYMHDPSFNRAVHGTTMSPGANPSAGMATATALSRNYSQVDNGVSSIAGYGFGDGNRYSQGTPAGGYAQSPAPNAPAAPSQGVGHWLNTPQMTAHTAIAAPAAKAAAPVATKPGFTGIADGLTTSGQRDAYAYLKDLLDQYGLGSLTGFATQELTQGRTQSEVALDLQATPEFKAAFPEIAARQAAGLPAIGPGEIVSYRNAATQMMRAAGLPPGFYDSPKDLAGLIGGDVSLTELNERINQAKDATYNIDPAAASHLHQMFGLAPGSGELAAYFLDPQKALPLLQRQVQAAKIGGAADETGYAGLNNATALDLAQAGVTDSQARAGFTALGHEHELFGLLPGEQGADIGQGQQLAAQFLGNSAAQDAISRRQQDRLAQFNDGGAYVTSGKGATGLGSAT